MPPHSLLTGPLRAAAFVMIVAALVVTGPVPVPHASAQTDVNAEATMANLLGSARGAHGRAPVRVCADLRDLARAWSSRMADEGRLSHNSGLEAQAGGWRSLGENVGYDFSVERVHQRFMDSAPHRAHILSTTYTEVGIGVESRAGQVWVTEIFREPSGSAPCPQVALDERIATACPPGDVPPAAFPDVHGNIHRPAIDCTGWYELTNGTDTGAYAPADAVTRAQMATFLARLGERSGLTMPPPRDQGFNDIDGNPHADAINQLAQLGVVHGLAPTTYGPNVVVTRGQMATFLVRAFERMSGPMPLATRDWFVDDNGLVHEDATNRASEAGFVTGVSPTAYAPHDAVRRDQLASFLARTLNRMVERGTVAPPS